MQAETKWGTVSMDWLGKLNFQVTNKIPEHIQVQACHKLWKSLQADMKPQTSTMS